MTSSESTTPSPRSGFVTALAWVFIVLSGFGVLISLLQNLMLSAFPQDAFNEALQDASTTQEVPAGARFMFGHFRLLVALMLLVLVTTLVAAIGLLRRHNWARILFMIILGLGVIYSLGGVALQQHMMPDFSRFSPVDSTASEAVLRMGAMIRVVQLVMIIISLGFAGLFAWLIWKLASPSVRREFGSPRSAA
jgi:hypothetical protein